MAGEREEMCEDQRVLMSIVHNSVSEEKQAHTLQEKMRIIHE
jgi:hypothetical protein